VLRQVVQQVKLGVFVVGLALGAVAVPQGARNKLENILGAWVSALIINGHWRAADARTARFVIDKETWATRVLFAPAVPSRSISVCALQSQLIRRSPYLRRPFHTPVLQKNLPVYTLWPRCTEWSLSFCCCICAPASLSVPGAAKC